jgi:RHS repeat-associated protein
VLLVDNTTKLEESVYNTSGERVGMVSYQGGAVTGFTKFLRDGAAVVYEKSFTISGSTHANKSEKTYLYGAGRMAVTKDTTLTGTAVSTYTYYGVDHLGTVRYSKTINSSGLPVSGGLVSYAFEPFGVMIPGQSASISPNGNTHLYTGHERDTLADGSNMDYMHFRFFSSNMGRFQKPDSNFDSPLSNPQGWNLYSYVKGNPVNFNDPTGHLPPGGEGTVGGPLWSRPTIFINHDPAVDYAGGPFYEGAGTIGSANTFSMLGQTMNPQQATGQAAPQAQTTMFDSKDYSFKLDPTVPKPAGGTLGSGAGTSGPTAKATTADPVEWLAKVAKSRQVNIFYGGENPIGSSDVLEARNLAKGKLQQAGFYVGEPVYVPSLQALLSRTAAAGASNPNAGALFIY